MGNKASKGKNPNDPEPNPNDPDLGIKTQPGQNTTNQSKKIKTGQNTTNQSQKIRTGQNTTNQSQKIRTGQSSTNQSQKIKTGLSSKTQKGELQIPDSQQLQLYKKPDQEKIGEGEYAIVYKKNNQKVVRKVPTFIHSEGIASTITELRKLQNNFQEIINRSQTGENIGSFIIAENEIRNYDYINEHDEIKDYFPSKIKNIGIVPYIDFLEGYITFKDFITDSKISRITKKNLMKEIVGILQKLHDNGFYHRDLYSLENIMIIPKSQDTYDVKFIDLGLSLNDESIQNYSKNQLDLFFNAHNPDFVGVTYVKSVVSLLGNFQTNSSEETLAISSKILKDADLCMFLVSCQYFLNDGEKDFYTRERTRKSILMIRNYDDLSSQNINSIIDYTIV